MKYDIKKEVGRSVELFGIKGFYLVAIGIILVVNIFVLVIVYSISTNLLLNFAILCATVLIPTIVVISLNKKGEKIIDSYLFNLSRPKYIIQNKHIKNKICELMKK